VSSRPLRVAILSPVWFPVPPTGYGGIEWIVALLADGLVAAGHEPTLFASGDSRTRARLAHVYRRAPSEHIGQTYWELRHALSAFSRAGDFDVIHDHTGMLGLTLGGLVDTPVVHTVHGPLDGEPGEMYEQICSAVPDAMLISLSMNQRRPKPDLPWLANCPNAIEFSLYPVHPHPGDYLLFVGRMSHEKGCHRAVAVAVEAGLPLKIAGKKREPPEEEYFREYVAPHLNDRIEYLGEVNHGEKVELMQNARAVLFPIQWEEPFGLVMIEAMACGTPVIATRWGAVPEVIEPGVTGVIVDHYREMPAALEAADELDPLEIRHQAEQRFAPERMVADYVRAYRRALGEPDEDDAAVVEARFGSA
jgi:glycosyltransferase involved in cell wall biosynthesis